jgi:hypothetical protein
MLLFFPALFITSRVRNSSKQANTLLAYEDAIKRLYEWAASKKIDLELRLSDQQFLVDHEVESLVRSVGRKRSSRRRESTGACLPISEIVPKRLAERQISNASKYRHLTYISRYLRWLAQPCCSVSGRRCFGHPCREKGGCGGTGHVAARRSASTAGCNALGAGLSPPACLLVAGQSSETTCHATRSSLASSCR